MLRNFDDVIRKVQGLPIKRLVIASAHDKDIICLSKQLLSKRIASPILIGDIDMIRKHCLDLDIDSQQFEIVNAKNETDASAMAVSYIRLGKADFVMKGLLQTKVFLKAVLERQYGLRGERILSQISIIEYANRERLILLTDCAINITPDLSTKVKIIQNAVAFYRLLSAKRPRIAVLAALEQVNPDMPETVDAAILAQMGQRGQIGGLDIDGPLALDNILSRDAAIRKGIRSPVAGCADIIVAPDLKTGNVLHKAAVFLAGLRVASFVGGTIKPVIITSRTDAMESKLFSVALASLAAAMNID